VIDLVVGGFYGDEGKGKVASYLALNDDPAFSLRTGGINAGHTVVFEEKKYPLRTIPSAFVNRKSKLAIPPGALIKLDVLFKEMDETGSKNRVIIDGHAAVITEEEVNEEKSNKFLSGEVGSTVQGVGSAESKRILRRLKLAKDYPEISGFIKDVPLELTKALAKGKGVLVEGTQGHLLSLYHGAYPYVTSRNATSSGVLSEVGVGPKYVGNVILVFKSFITRVGAGPLEGELSPTDADKMGMVEYGTVTGRRRRVADFDAELAKDVASINSATQIAITKLDIRFKNVNGIKRYEKLPSEAKRWIEKIEKEVGIPVTLIGTGEDVYDIIDLRDEKISGR
jgi:adenylosuccinate synthase